MTRILVLGTADWNQPIATNQHYVVRELAQKNPLTFVESMGLRTPELSVRDVKRAARRLSPSKPTGTRATRAIPAGVTVVSPKAIPRHVGLARQFNARVVDRFAEEWASSSEFRILWTYSPVTYGLEQVADAVVYHCVDLLGKVEGIPEQLIDSSERTLTQRADVAIGSSGRVVEHLKEIGFPSVVSWPNVADTKIISEHRPPEVQRQRGRVVFAGNLSTTKIDFDLLRAVAESGADLHLAGPIAEGGGSADSEVRDLERAGATYHGMLSLDALADLYWTADVGLIPYALNPYTSGVSPLKTYEYLAAGLTVVSTALPSMNPVQNAVLVSDSRASFLTDLSVALGDDNSDGHESRIALANAHSWSQRGVEARTIITELEARHAE